MRKYATALAVVLGLALVLYPIIKTEEVTGVTAIGVSGVVFLATSLTWRRARPLSVVAALLIGLHYAFALQAAQENLDVYSVLVGAGLFVVFEATSLAIESIDVAPLTRPSATRRTATTLSITAAGALLAVLGLLAHSLFTSDFTGVVIGTICALGLLALPLRLAQRAD
jgi:hypothetical protein